MNHKLKQAREAAGLSQEELARMIETNATTISGWERGEHYPSLHFREKLCSALGKTADELGFSSSSKELVASPYDPFIPLQHVALKGRDEQLAQIRQHLLVSRSACTVLLGLPGVGKSSLAATLAHDPRVRQHFRDGVLWASLGPQPDIPRLLSRWGRLLGIPTPEITDLSAQDAWMEALRSAIGSRSLLLIIDDAWTIEDVLAFQVGARCAYLLTTRFPGVATSFSIKESLFTIRELETADGIALLQALAPDVVDDEEARKLVEAVGGLPLALTLMGNYLRRQGYGGQPRRIQSALQHLSLAEQRFQLSEPQITIEGHTLPGARISLQAVIALSDHYLNEEARQALGALTMLPTKPNSFTEEEALSVIAGSSVEVLDMLVDAGLLENAGENRYTLHQTIADYARTRWRP